MNRARWSALFDGLSFATLTILVWGVNAPRRGLWQDDVQALGEAFQRSSSSFPALLRPDASPLRRLTLLPSALANLTSQPIWALHLLCAVIWLAQGLVAGWMVALLLPGRRWTRFVVTCLTLTATSDFTTGSMVALAYNLAALLALAAIASALLWLRDGRVAALIISSVLLVCSLLTMEVALPALPLLALLFLWLSRWHPRRRVIGLLAAWGIVLVPILIVEWRFLHDPASYAATALLPLSRTVLLKRTIRLWLDNFTPWRWAFARPEWYARPHAVISSGWMAAGSLLAATLFLLRLRTKENASTPREAPGGALLASLFAAMALAANAAYAQVWFSELHYRSYILSRVWAAVAIGILAGWVVTREARLRWAAGAVVTAFVFLGTWGGIERQDFYLAAWLPHQRELASILRVAPALRPGTAVILRGSPPRGQYVATEADYLTKHWLRLLYDTPGLKAMRLDPQRGSVCMTTAAGPLCWSETQAACFARRSCPPTRFRFEELVVMDYAARAGTYHLVRSLHDDPLANGYAADAERYHPERRIISQAWTPRQRALLLLQ